MKKIKALIILTSLSLAGFANAETTTATSQVTATVTATCSIVGMPTVAMELATHPQSGLGGSTEYWGEIAFMPRCTKGTAYSVSIGGGLHTDGSVRRMKNTSTNEMLVYGIRDPINGYAEAGISTIYRNGIGVGTDIDGPEDVPFEVYFDNTQRVSAGTYEDTVTITITY